MRRMFDRLPAGTLFILLAALWGCKPVQEVAQSDTVKIITVKEVVRDTTIYMTDSAGLYALLYCDSIGQARVRQIEQFYAGQFIRPKVVLKDNYIKVECKVDSAAIGVRWVERYGTKTVQLTRQIIEKVNYVTGWQWFQIWIGRIALAAGIAVALFYSVKSAWWAVLLSWAVKLMRRLFTKKK